MSTVSHTGGVTLDGFLAAGITVSSAAAIFVALRLGANWRIHKRLLIDDCMVTAASKVGVSTNEDTLRCLNYCRWLPRCRSWALLLYRGM